MGAGLNLPWLVVGVMLLDLSSLGLVAAAESLEEDPRFALCPSEAPLPSAPGFATVREPGTAEISADRLKASDDGRSVFVGGVELVREQQALRADRVSYDREHDLVEAHGNLRLWDPAIFWSGRYGRLDLDVDRAQLEDGEYRLLARRGHGRARVTKLYPKEDLTRLKDVDYTTCDGAVPDWKLSAKRIKLDHNEEWGSAQKVTLKVRDVPVFYLPYISFPISDKRKSGFLPPTIGSSSDTGFDLSVPYYWNIAPEQDATFAPRVLSDRGVMLGGQYRYLLREGRGQLDAEYLPSDRQFDDDRSLIGFTHEQRLFGDRGNAFVTFNRVSDDEYFEDFGSSLALASTRFLQQRAELSYAGDQYFLRGRLFRFQTVDPSVSGDNRPYDRLPQLFIRAFLPRRNQAINLEVRGEATYFDRDEGPIGGRIDLRPTLSYPIYAPWGFLVPRLSLNHTQYLLENTEGAADSPDRTLPIVSADGGAVFERDLVLGSSTFRQTLEPRAFYLYIPDSDQDDIPIFDTGEYDVSFFQLFRENRFNGPDRIGDANQVTLALTSRLIDRANAWEQLRASVGQIFYFQDRDVNLPPSDEVNTDSVSEFVGELSTRFKSGLSARAALIWDPNKSEVEKGVFGLRYWPDQHTIVNAEYRIRQEIRGIDRRRVLGLTEVDQTDLSLRWPLNPNWSVVGRWNYSLDNSETLEAVAGIEYESCCWGVRVVGRRFLSTFSGEFDNAVFVQVELKGLAGFGRSTTGFLKKSIPGYDNEL